MRKFSLAAILLSFAFLAPACSDASKKYQEFADKECACTAKECGSKVVDDFAAWLKANKGAHGNQDKAKKATEKFMGCAAKNGVPMSDLLSKLSNM